MGRLQSIGQAHVGDDREAEATHLAMHGHDHLRHRGHADHIRPAGPQPAVLGPRLQVRTGDGHIDTPLHRDALAHGHVPGEREQLLVIGLAHVREALAQPFVVVADQGVVAEHVDVIVDQHDVPLAPLRVHAAASVGDDQHVAAQGLEHTHRKGDGLERIALVGMETPLHRHHALAAERAGHQSASVRGGGAVGEVGDFLIAEGAFGLDVGRQPAQAGAQDDAHARLAVPPAANEGGCLGDLLEECCCHGCGPTAHGSVAPGAV